MKKIILVSDFLTAKDLLTELEQVNSDLHFEIESQPKGSRGVDFNFISTICDCTAHLLALISAGITIIHARKKKGIITIKTDGVELSFPKGTTDAEIIEAHRLEQLYKSLKSGTRLNIDTEEIVKEESLVLELMKAIPKEHIENHIEHIEFNTFEDD